MIEVVAMVYKSPEFLRFIQDELKGLNYRLVGNNPSPAIVDACDGVYHDPNPNDWYLSRVYRCWNWCVESSKADHVCLVNSDMAFSPGWLEALERYLNGSTLPTSRLVERGKDLQPGTNAIQADFGDRPSTFDRDGWIETANLVRGSGTLPGGCYMPCVLNREAFLSVGGYPDGNVADGVVVNRMPKPSDREYLSGDVVLFKRMEAIGYKHVTVLESVVYHMQEGEMRA